MSLTCCLQCKCSLPPASKTSRYCPTCGWIRVLPDPPDPHMRTPIDRVIVAGYDTFGADGRIYAYEQPEKCPTLLDALTGPHRSPEGIPWQDLVASSDTPLPLTAHYISELPKGYPAVGGLALDFGAPLTHLVVRHSRFYALTRGAIARQQRTHQLVALDTRTGTHAPAWNYQEFNLPTAAPCGPVQLQASETLLSCLVRTSRGTRLQLYNLASGEPYPELTLACERPRILVSGDFLLVLPEVLRARPNDQSVQVYRISEWTPSAPPQPCSDFTHHIGASLSELPPIAALGDSFILASVDGKICRLEIRKGEPARELQVLWSNPSQACLWPTLVTLDANTIAFVASQGPNLHLVEVSISPGSQEFQTRSTPLPLMAASRSRFLAAWDGQIFAAVHPPGQPISIHRLTRVGDSIDCEILKSFEATGEADIREFQAFPHRGGTWLYIHYIARPGAFAPHRFLIDDAGLEHDIEGRPDASDVLRFVWQTGAAWVANLTRGAVAPIK